MLLIRFLPIQFYEDKDLIHVNKNDIFQKVFYVVINFQAIHFFRPINKKNKNIIEL
jgi:hypothetical protein